MGWLCFGFVFVCLLIPECYAQNLFEETPQRGLITLQNMLLNLDEVLPELEDFLRAFAYLAGIIFIVRGLYQLKIYGEMRTMMSNNADIKGPIKMFVVGAVLMYLPGAFEVSFQTLFDYSLPKQVDDVDFGSKYSNVARALMHLVQLIGLISFIRGWFMIAKSGGPQQGGGFGKGMIHIIGGIMAVNVYGMMEILYNTFGFGRS